MTQELRNLLRRVRKLDAGLHGTCWGEHWQTGKPRFYQLKLVGANGQLLWKGNFAEEEYYEAVTFWLRLPKRAEKAA